MYIYIHEDDNNMSYEDNMVFNTYFESYGEAYEDVINTLAFNYFLRERDWYPHTHYIVRIKLGTDIREVVSVYYCKDKKWIHKGAEQRRDIDRLNEISKNIPILFKGCNIYHIEKYLEARNGIFVEEMAGYEKFCKRTLSNYLKGKISQYIRLYHYHDINGNLEARDRVISDFITPLRNKLEELK